MDNFDTIYISLGRDLLENGAWDTSHNVRAKYVDGKPAYTKSLINKRIMFDNATTSSLLTSKRVPQKDPINELQWIWKYKSNNVKFLREELGCNVWNEWEQEDGTINRAYGWQLKNKLRQVPITNELVSMIDNGMISDNWKKGRNKTVYLDQVDYLIYILKTNPHSRRIKTTLWCVEDLDNMALEPCVYETHWQIWNGKLHLTVNVRSNDFCLGNPYNVFQYSVLHKMVAQVTGHEVGMICFNIDNLHVYDRHIETLVEQINGETFAPPSIEINPDIKSFYGFNPEDVAVLDYKHNGSFKYEVAI